MPVDVVPPEARVELDRLRRRWGELPLARAEAAMPLLRRLLDDLGRRSAPEESSVPDLGPGVVAHQLAVLVWDAYAVGRGGRHPRAPHGPAPHFGYGPVSGEPP